MLKGVYFWEKRVYKFQFSFSPVRDTIVLFREGGGNCGEDIFGRGRFGSDFDGAGVLREGVRF